MSVRSLPIVNLLALAVFAILIGVMLAEPLRAKALALPLVVALLVAFLPIRLRLG